MMKATFLVSGRKVECEFDRYGSGQAYFSGDDIIVPILNNRFENWITSARFMLCVRGATSYGVAVRSVCLKRMTWEVVRQEASEDNELGSDEIIVRDD